MELNPKKCVTEVTPGAACAGRAEGTCQHGWKELSPCSNLLFHLPGDVSRTPGTEMEREALRSRGCSDGPRFGRNSLCSASATSSLGPNQAAMRSLGGGGGCSGTRAAGNCFALL